MKVKIVKDYPVNNLKPLEWFKKNMADGNISLDDLISYNESTEVLDNTWDYELLYKDYGYALIKNPFESDNNVYCVHSISIESPKFDVGDSVKIVDKGYIYRSYEEFFNENNLDRKLLARWQWEGSPNVEDVYEVKFIGKHRVTGAYVFVIMSREDSKVYLIGGEGLKLKIY